MERGNKVWRELPLPPLPLSIHRRPAATTTTASGRADDSNCGFPPPIPVLPLAPGCLVAVVQWHSAWCYGFQRSPERARVRLPGSTTGIMTHRATAQPPHQSPFFFLVCRISTFVRLWSFNPRILLPFSPSPAWNTGSWEPCNSETGRPTRTKRERLDPICNDERETPPIAGLQLC